MTSKLFLILAFLSFGLSIAQADDPAAEQIFVQRCGMCHDQGANERTPTREALRHRSRLAINRALTVGVMKQQGATLTADERSAVVNWLGTAQPAVLEHVADHCAASPALATKASAPSWLGWGNGLGNIRFQPGGPGALTKEDVPRLKLKWAFGLADDTTVRSQPAVYGGRVFIGSQSGTVYSLDAETGCVHWALEGVTPVRTGIVIGRIGDRDMVFFGGNSAIMYGADAETGRLIWQRKMDDHPVAIVTGTPALYNGSLYVPVASNEEGSATDPAYLCCTFRGSLSSLDPATGAVRWKTYTIDKVAKQGPATKRGDRMMGPSGAGIWTAPTVDTEKGIIYVTTGNNYSTPTTGTSDAVLAIAIKDGKILWAKQFTSNDAYVVTCRVADKKNCPDDNGEDTDFATPPILTKLKSGRRALILGQKSGILYAADPDRKGEVIWQSTVGRGHTITGIQGSPATDGDKVYVARSDFMYERHRDASGKRIITTADAESGGGMFAFLLQNGERLWYTPPAPCGDRKLCSPANHGAVSAMPGVTFSGSLDGHLRAYDTTTGAVIFDYDTVRDYQTVNGIPAKGGSLGFAGAAIAGPLVFVGSGYADLGGMPGNVLLAFGK